MTNHYPPRTSDTAPTPTPSALPAKPEAITPPSTDVDAVVGSAEADAPADAAEAPK